jgi:hypothetical protein
MIKIPIHGVEFAFIDNEFLPLVSDYKWYIYKSSNNCIYAQGYHPKTKKRVLMHRLIMNPPRSLHVDHRNRNGLDNRLFNLRIATRSQNLSNRTSAKNSSSRFLGVTFHKKANKWVANICKLGRKEYLGLFATENDAAMAYNEKAKFLHGEFANLNQV